MAFLGALCGTKKIWTYFCEIEAVVKAAYVMECLMFFQPIQSEFYELFVKSLPLTCLVLSYHFSPVDLI